LNKALKRHSEKPSSGFRPVVSIAPVAWHAGEKGDSEGGGVKLKALISSNSSHKLAVNLRYMIVISLNHSSDEKHHIREINMHAQLTTLLKLVI